MKLDSSTIAISNVSRLRPLAQRGFTLIEVVIAFSILVVVFGLSYSSLSGIISAKQLLDDGRDAQIMANAVMSRITRELQLADAQTALLPEKGDPNNRPAGNINLIGAPGTIGSNAPADTISFMAKGAGQYILGNQAFSGEVKISYRLAEDPEQRGADQTFLLIREETPNIRPLDKAFDRTMIFPVTDRMVGLNIRYFDREEGGWHNDWGKDERVGLPAIVELTIGIRSPQGNLFTYTTAVPLLSSQQ